MRSWKGGPPNGTNMDKVFVLQAWQNGQALPIEINYDKVIWSGLSWAVGEIRQSRSQTGGPSDHPVRLGRERSREPDRGKVYRVQY